MQEGFEAQKHYFTIGLVYSLIFFLNTMIFTLFVILKGKIVGMMPFLLYVMGLFFAEQITNNILLERVKQLAPVTAGTKKFQIRWVINPETYTSLAWAIFDLALDFLILRWALNFSISNNLVIGLFLGSKSIGIFFQSVLCHFQSVRSQIWVSFLIALVFAYFILIIAEMKPISQIVLSAITMKGLFGNFLVLARIKLAQNSEIKIVD